MPVSSDTTRRDPVILPQPRTLRHYEGYFLLTRETVIVTDQQMHRLGTHLANWLAPGLAFAPAVVSGELDDIPSAIVLAMTPDLASMGPEGYTLKVTPQQVTIRSSQLAGLFYGIQTLRQLLPVEIFSSTSENCEWQIPAVEIEDVPLFPWRGLLLDTVRHFIPKNEIFKFIDLLALHKMNVLHLHLTDDQGWRIEIKKYPRLIEVGSRRKETVVGHARFPEGYDGIVHEGFYSQDDLREIVAYAADRFITVVPEIEVPGHAQAAVASYPELGVTGEAVEVAMIWGIHPYLYNPSEKTLQFLQDVLTEVMEIFPGRYIHIGGDEARKDQWEQSPEVQARIQELGLKNEEELQSWFLTQIGTFLAQHGRRYIGWDEILDGGLPQGAVVMSWQGIEGGIRAAQAGHDVIMTPYTHTYFDSYQSHDPAEPLAIGFYSPLENVYSFNPVPEVLSTEQARHIIGVQGALWTEYIATPEHLEYMAFPRLVALAEVIWTPGERRDFADFCRRLAIHEARLTSLNVNFRPVARLQQDPLFPPRKDPMAKLPPESPTPEL